MEPIYDEFELSGHVYIPEGTTFDDFWSKFIGWVEENNWTYGGLINPVTPTIPKEEA